MDIKKIQELVKLINKTSIGEITIEEEGVKITIKQKKDPDQNIYYGGGQAAPAMSAAPVQAAAPVPMPTASGSESVAPAAPVKDNLITIKSPMIGTFYRQPGVGKAILANVGDVIETGKVLCIIEAMKLFNEIESEVKGTIVKVLVEDESPVEYDQPLFLVDPA